jgi:hypothetical protein
MSTETQTDRQSLDALAAELGARIGMLAQVYATEGGSPFLKATNLQTPLLTERITVSGDHYRWSWGDTIGPISDPGAAATQVVRVIRDQ